MGDVKKERPCTCKPRLALHRLVKFKCELPNKEGASQDVKHSLLSYQYAYAQRLCCLSVFHDSREQCEITDSETVSVPDGRETFRCSTCNAPNARSVRAFSGRLQKHCGAPALGFFDAGGFLATDHTNSCVFLGLHVRASLPLESISLANWYLIVQQPPSTPA